MNDRVRDDPRQVLAILNSLGVVGLTAEELKAFMKELKLYRKIKERERQQWKEELREKIYRKQYNYLLQKKKNIEENAEKPKENKKKTIEMVVDTTQSRNKTKKTEKQTPIVTISAKPCPRLQRICSKSKENVAPKKTVSVEIDKRPASAPGPPQRTEIRLSRRRSRSVTQVDRGTNLTEHLPRSKSFIRSKSLLPDPKKNNRGNNDPVALYEKYSAYWNTISFPGEESHARLRWSIREKMLGSGDSKNHYQEKKSARTTGSSSARSSKITVVC